MNKLKLIFAALLISCFGMILFSCKTTTGVTPTNYTRLRVINTLAGSTPFNFYINFTIKSAASITYPGASGYVSVLPGTSYFQLSLATTPNIYFYSTSLILKQDSSYSIFITGQTAPYKSIFTRDDLSSPAQGKAKVRFVNASLSASNLDVTVNATTAYNNIAQNNVGAFVEVPAGTYEFKAYEHGATSSTLATLSNQVLADGKVYTLYSQGVVGNTVTTSAFGLTLITNLLPAVK